MCSGAKIPSELYHACKYESIYDNTYVDSKIIDCYHLLNNKYDSTEPQRIEELKKGLIKTMNELMEGNLILKQNHSHPCSLTDTRK